MSIYRDACEEQRIYGQVLCSKNGQVIFQSGDTVSRIPGRSLLKPFQLLATGLVDPASPVEPSLIPALGSISATREQVAELRQWHPSPNADVLQIGNCLPQEGSHRVQMQEAGSAPNLYCHPCFSKHMALLRACRQHGWPESNYCATGHPLHTALVAQLEPLLRPRGRSLQWVVDGCQLPSPVLGLDELLACYHYLATSDEASTRQVREAMLAQPQWIGGPGRIDTRLMELNPGRLIAKEGADGLLALGILNSAEVPGGAAMVVKLSGGYQPQSAALALEPHLLALGLSPLPRSYQDKDLSWHAPERAVVHDISPPLAETFDEVSLAPYRGACQVITVNRLSAGLITEESFDTQVVAPRVLFRTGSFPDPERFNENFAGCSPDLVRWLRNQGVILLGIDTPSVDLFSSETLDAHRETQRGQGIAILEGLSLKDVSDGLYELCALPLKSVGGDASPVRAVLYPIR